MLPTRYSNLKQGEIRNPSEVSGVARQQGAAGEQRGSGNYTIWDLEPVLSPNESGQACDTRVHGDNCHRGQKLLDEGFFSGA